MSTAGPPPGGYEPIELYARRRACDLVRVVVSDNYNPEQGIEQAHRIAESVNAESGADGLALIAVELCLGLACALERLAASQGLTADDLAGVWFTDWDR